MTDAPAARPRVEALDVVRGLAVLGILPVNAAFFAYPEYAALNPGLTPQPAFDPANASAWAVMHVGFEFKMITLFSMLFGISIFLVGGERTELEKGAQLRRRLAWLAVFGVLHGAFIWYGDILLLYAVCGFFVLLFRSLKASTLLIAGGVLFVFAFGLHAVLAAGAEMMAPSDLMAVKAEIWNPGDAEIARSVFAMQAGLGSALQENIDVWLGFVTYAPYYAPRTIALMLLGMGLYKAGFFHGRAETLAYVGSILSAIAALFVLSAASARAIEARYPFTMLYGYEGLWNFGLSLIIALGYASALVLLVKANAARAITGALANVGRLAFTNYLTQSLIMTTIFVGGRGFGLFGDVDRVGLWGIVFAIWAAQIVWSALWLRAFAMGPFEWLWRSLTMMRPAKLRRET